MCCLSILAVYSSTGSRKDVLFYKKWRMYRYCAVPDRLVGQSVGGGGGVRGVWEA